VQGRSIIAVLTFGAEGASGGAPVMKAQGKQGLRALAQDVASGVSGSADEAPEEA
jgi:hypothetical protein